MQFEIADDVAITFAHEFYGALADGYPIDASLTEARKAIFAGGREVEWATPVLYLRAPDGRVFDVNRRAPDEIAATTVAAPATRAAEEPTTPPQRAARLLREADAALANGEFETALERLRDARVLDPHAPALLDLAAKAEEQRAVATTRARRRAVFQEHLRAASELLAKGDPSAALDRVSEAVQLRPDDADARALQLRIRQVLDRGGEQHGAPSGATPGGENLAAAAPPCPAAEPHHAIVPARSGENRQGAMRVI